MIRLKYIALIFLVHNQLQAQGPPITTETPIMLGLEGSAIRTFLKITDSGDGRLTSWILGMPYNIHTNLQVGAILPYTWQDQNGGSTANGLGDVSLFIKAMLFKKDGRARTFRILATARQSFPTAAKSLRGADQPEIYQTHLGLVFGNVTTRIGLYGDIGYRFISSNLSDHFVYNFSVGVPLLPVKYPQKQINAYLEFNADHAIDGPANRVSLSPGLQFIPGRRFLAEVSYSLPLTTDSSINWSLLSGIRFLLN